MAHLPDIVVKLIHIKGPLKGQIQEFAENRISIGRHPANDVCFPPAVDIVSRNHASIVRKGNRYQIVDHSSNGTFVNGKKITEALLKDGDVLCFADMDKGPKASFLTEMREKERPVPEKPPSLPEEPFHPSLFTQQPRQPDSLQPGPPENVQPVVEATPVPLAIQFGPTLRSFKALPITIGAHPSSDFQLDYPGVFDRHAQIFFFHDDYWIKDLTGQNAIKINSVAVGTQSVLKPDDMLSLGAEGPVFRFLGGGRLVEA